MKRIEVYVVGLALALVPAVFGLWGNASFSQAVPVRVPEHARIASVDHPSEAVDVAREAGRDRAGEKRATRTPNPAASTRTTHDVADDHGGTRSGSGSGSSTSDDGGHQTSGGTSGSGSHDVAASSHSGSDDAAAQDSGSHHSGPDSGNTGSGDKGSGGHGSDG